MQKVTVFISNWPMFFFSLYTNRGKKGYGQKITRYCNVLVSVSCLVFCMLQMTGMQMTTGIVIFVFCILNAMKEVLQMVQQVSTKHSLMYNCLRTHASDEPKMSPFWTCCFIILLLTKLSGKTFRTCSFLLFFWLITSKYP